MSLSYSPGQPAVLGGCRNVACRFTTCIRMKSWRRCIGPTASTSTAHFLKSITFCEISEPERRCLSIRGCWICCVKSITRWKAAVHLKLSPAIALPRQTQCCTVKAAAWRKTAFTSRVWPPMSGCATAALRRCEMPDYRWRAAGLGTTRHLNLFILMSAAFDAGRLFLQGRKNLARIRIARGALHDIKTEIHRFMA